MVKRRPEAEQRFGERGRPSKPTGPLTDEQRQMVLDNRGLAAMLANSSEPGMQAADREDAIGEAFLQLCLSARTFRSDKGCKVCTHLGCGVNFHMRTAFRRRRAMGFGGMKHMTTADMIASRPNPVDFEAAEAVFVAEIHDGAPPPDLTAALATLSDRDRFIIRGWFYDGRKLHEIAADLGISKERVRQRRTVAVEQLKTYFGVEDPPCTTD